MRRTSGIEVKQRMQKGSTSYGKLLFKIYGELSGYEVILLHAAQAANAENKTRHPA